MLKELLGKNLKYHRQQRKLTQEMASELCDLSPRYWGKIERGDAAASIDTIEKISVGMEIDIAELFQEREASEEESPSDD